MIPKILCLQCKHYSDNLKCKAFPKGIPQEIVNGEVDHISSYDGDKGIQYEEKELVK